MRLIKEMGLDAVFFARNDIRDFQWRKLNKQMELRWKLNAEESIFTHILFNHYEPPQFLAFNDNTGKRATPVIIDKDSDVYTGT